MTDRLLIVAAAALIRGDGAILLAQRPAGKPMAGLWEFPGGKLTTGETPEQALQRELHEELALAVCVKNLVPLDFASHDYMNFHLLMPLYECRTWTGEPVAVENQALAWVRPDALHAYPAPDADRPLFERLAKRMT